MRVELQDVSKGLALPATSVAFSTGEVVVTVAETEQRPTVLGLIASGRMRPAEGRVLVDGAQDAASLRRRVALVDAPAVSDPAPDVTVAGVTAEELMFAGRTANPIAVRRWLDNAGYGDLARMPFGDVSPRERIGLLLELTSLRVGIEGIVLVSPDRHGGDPRESRDLLASFAARGLAILVIVGEAAATLLRMPEADGPTTQAESPPDTIGEAPDAESPELRAAEPREGAPELDPEPEAAPDPEADGAEPHGADAQPITQAEPDSDVPGEAGGAESPELRAAEPADDDTVTEEPEEQA